MVRELALGGCERTWPKWLCTWTVSCSSTLYVGCFIAKGLRFDELSARNIPVVEFPVRAFLSASMISGVRAMARYIRTHSIRLVHPFDVPTTLFGVPVARALRNPRGRKPAFLSKSSVIFLLRRFFCSAWSIAFRPKLW